MANKGRKRKLDSEDTMIDWERDFVMTDELHNEMKTMWEIPQIYHFLHLTKEALNIGPLSMYEMERMVMMPRASKQLAHIMTCLLSPPALKTKLRRIPPMPYEYWTNILTHKIKNWFKIYHSKHEDAVKVLEVTGVEPEFWKIFSDVSSIEGKEFGEMTFRQRVWLLKTVCDAMMHTRKTVQEEMAKQLTEETAETVLGTDRHGARYIYFPQIMENDVRVYRHCLDNKILSTVKAPKIKVEPKSDAKVNDAVGIPKSNRTRRRKCRWRNGSLPPRIKKRIKRQNEISTCEYTSEGIIESLGSEDTNLSNASLYSNNNNSELSSVRSKRSRSSSKNSEESLTSIQTKSSHAKSSGYDTNTSNDAKSNDEMPFQKDFNGFSKDADTTAQNVAKKITTINSQLVAGDRLADIDGCSEAAESDNAKTVEGDEIDKETTEELIPNGTKPSDIENDNSQSKISESEFQPKSNDEPSNKTDLVTDSMSTSKPSDIELSSKEISDTTSTSQIDELSKSSKTDDEKLNDIMSIDSNVSNNEKKTEEEAGESKKDVDIDEILSISKSDDQKLIETKLKDIIAEDSKNSEGSLDVEITATVNDDSTKEIFETRSAQQSEVEDKSNDGMEIRARRGPRRTVKSIYKRPDIFEDNKSECSSEEEPTLSELKDRLLKEKKDNLEPSCDQDIPVWEKYNLRKPTKIKKEESTDELVENFQEMLNDLSFSTFELVADSIESLRELVMNNFSRSNTENINNAVNRYNQKPQCEIKLAKKINDLIATLEVRQPSLADSTKKARAKLHKEWTNFETGVVEDQDWSSEGSLGLGTNWWVIGSQGCNPLLPTGDATISPLPQPTLPSPGTHHQPHPPDDSKRENKDQDEIAEDTKKQEQEQDQEQEREQQSQGTDANQGEPKDETISEQDQLRQSQGNSRRKKAIKEENNEEENIISRRVLRARGVSSYMEQFSTSDDEIEEDELEGWPDFEAKYASACASPSIPAVHNASTSGQAETWQSEDSDQDWILPGARKRKNRRSVTRKLKSLQQKLQNMNNSDGATAKDSPVEKSPNSKEVRSDGNKKNQNHSSSKLVNINASIDAVTSKELSQTVPSTTPICRIESVHSEIDIKDEIASTQNGDQHSQNISNYNLNVPSGGYVVVKTDQCPMANYYLMPQNTSVPGVVQQTTNIMSTNMVPQIQQGYYVQAGQNYFVQAPQQANFIATQTLQQQQHLHQQQQQQQQQQIIQTQQNRNQLIGGQNYMQMQPGGYVVQPQTLQPRSFIYNQGLRPPIIPAQNIRGQLSVRGRGGAPFIGNGTPFPHGAVIRSSVPPRGAARGTLAGRTKTAKNTNPRLIAPQKVNKKPVRSNKIVQKAPNKSGVNTASNTTSLIVLSDSDDEIEMIITDNKKVGKATPSTNPGGTNNETPKLQNAQKPVVTSHVTISPANSILPPQIIQRMSQGGISITPVKTQPTQNLQNPNTQLVVVVNETGSHYALALPNGSKLILTPEQVAQIRASNNGKLML